MKIEKKYSMLNKKLKQQINKIKKIRNNQKNR